MFSGISAWITGLSNVGKLSLASSAVAGTILVGSIASPEPDPIPTSPASQAQTTQRPTITTKVEVDTEVIPFDSRTIEDGSMAKGEKQVRTVGVDGVKTITYAITLTDGEETSRKISSEDVTLPPVTEVVAIGTYVAPAQAPQPASSSGVVKMSRSSICHAPGTTYYNQTKHYTSYSSLQACLNAGGRMPKR